MANESSERRPREVATSTFEEWVAQKARDRGSSRERVLKQLLDSFWTLEQIDQVLGGQGHTAPPADDRAANDHQIPAEGEMDGPVTEPDPTEILDTVETLQTELDTASHQRAELVEEVQTLADRLDDVEATQETVDELAETVSRVKSELETEHQRLYDRMDDEFDDLQTILEYLVQRGDEHETRITETQVQYRAEIRELRAEREQLRRIKEDARELGTYDADCDQCGASIDFALLSSPDCPNCERPLTGVERETNWFVFTSYTATTEPRATASQSVDAASEYSRDGRATAQRDDDVDAATTDETPTTDVTPPTDATRTDDEQTAQSETKQTSRAENETQTGERATQEESEKDDIDESAGTSPDETEFQWLS